LIIEREHARKETIKKKRNNKEAVKKQEATLKSGRQRETQ